MRTEAVTIAGLAGPVVVESPFWANTYTITVGGRPAVRTGRGRYALPSAAGGVVEATVRGGFLDTYPTLEVNGSRYRTGPTAPALLRVLVFVPLALLAIGGALGGLIGALAAMINMTVARLRVHVAVQALVMVGIATAAALVWYAIASVIAHLGR